MKTNTVAKTTAGRKILVLALAFMMVMQFNCMALSTAWTALMTALLLITAAMAILSGKIEKEA